MRSHGSVPAPTLAHAPEPDDDLRRADSHLAIVAATIGEIEARAPRSADLDGQLARAVEELRPRVLILDDDPMVGSSIARLVQHVGCTVELTERAADARVLLAAGRYDILLADYDLGGGETSEPLLAH